MQYTMLLWAHPNVRYRIETVKLAQAELMLMLKDENAGISVADTGELPALLVDVDEPLSQETVKRISAHSLMYALFENVGELLKLISSPANAYLMSDLPGILKYKGKTNEVFTKLLINAAMYSSAFENAYGLRLLDPMCGRGTTLFTGVNMGMNATGCDIDKPGLAEAEKFFKRYLEYHGVKHSLDKGSLTLRDGKPAKYSRFSFANAPERYKAGDTLTLRLVDADAANVREAFGTAAFHLIACDLPYGVQHNGRDVSESLKRSLVGWREALITGGAIAVSFNDKALPRETVLTLMREAGLAPMRGGAYEMFSHWVEQAVTRDIAISCKQ